MRFIRPGFLLSLVATILCSPAGAVTDVRVSAEAIPSILAQIELPDGLHALAISSDGSRLAYALASDREGSSDLVWVEAAAQSDPVTLQGTIRDLVFLDDDRTVAGLQHVPAKKHQGNTFLFAWGGEPKTRRIMRVPPSANDLDRWPGGNAILLACRNELRTLLSPDLRSGPLFSFPGDNFAVSSLGNSSYVVVGQNAGMFLLDLSVPSGRESMPILASLQLPARVAALADYPDGDEVLIRLVDGQLFRAGFDPPGLAPAGTADQIAGLSKAASGPVLPFAPAAGSVVVAEPETPATVHEASPDTTLEIVAPEVPDTVVEKSAPVIVADTHETEETQPPTEAAPAQPEPEHQIEGRLLGEVALVEFVVLLGPDNILRESARVRPRPDGSWVADGLEPGRYRIELDGGGDRVLVSEPLFLMVDIGQTPTRVPEIKAVRSF